MSRYLLKLSFRQIYIAITFSLIGANLSAQNFSYKEFVNEKDSIRRIELAIESWNYYVRNDIDSMRISGLEMINKDSLTLYPMGVRNLGTYHVRVKDINKGITLLLEARDLFLDLHLVLLLSETEAELGNAYFLKGDYNQASHFYFVSIVHGSQTSDITARYNGMIGFGKTLCATGDTTTGLLFIQKYLERSLRDNKFEAASDACGYLGMIAGLNGKVELMSAYYGRANRYASRSDSKTHQANAITNKAIDYFYHDKADSSIFLFQKSLLIRREVGATRPIVESLYNLAILNIETGNLDEARKYAEKGDMLSEEGGIKSWQLDCLILLLEIAESKSDKAEIIKVEQDIDRIQKELNEMGNLDEQIIDAAIEFTALHKKASSYDYFWELVGTISVLLSCSLLLYSERSSLT